MPYSIETRDGIVIDNIPDEIARDSDVLRQRVAQARDQRQAQSSAQAYRDAAAELTPGERRLANIGAGMSNLGLGVRQLASKIGLADAPTDAEIRDKRARDEALVDGWGDRGWQLVGEVAPTMVAPGGLLAGSVRAGAIGPTTALLGTGAISGAANAALAPVTSDESRGANMAGGAMLGAMIPVAGTAVGAGLRKGAQALTQSGATQRALQTISDFVPEAQRAALVQRLMEQGRRGVPESAAQRTGSAELAQLEAASRSKPSTQPGWARFDESRNAAVFDDLAALTPSELRMERLKLARDLATGPMRDRALSEAAQAGQVSAPVLAHAQDLLAGASGANPAVQRIANYTRSVLDEGSDPARLYEVRKVLASKLSGPSAIGDELSAAAKGAERETRGLIQAIDDSLEASSSGQWKPYLSEYAERSAPINSGRAMRDVADRIEQKGLLGATPQVTATGLQAALNKSASGKFGSRLTPEVQAATDELVDILRRGEAPGRTRKLAATQGGGSITNSDQLLGKSLDWALDAVPIIGTAKRVAQTQFGKLNQEATETELARLLMDPQALGKAFASLPESTRQRLLRQAATQSQLAAGQAAAAESAR